MLKVVLKLDVHHNDKGKERAMKIVCGLPGVESIAMDMKEKKMTAIGDHIDPVMIVSKLRKLLCYTLIVSVGPVKDKKKEHYNKMITKMVAEQWHNSGTLSPKLVRRVLMASSTRNSTFNVESFAMKIKFTTIYKGKCNN